MSIKYHNGQFHLQTKRVSYIFSVYRGLYLTHLYWGARLEHGVDLTYLPEEFIFSRANAFHVPLDSENRVFLSDLKLEFSVVGGGDYRVPAFHARYGDGSTVSEFAYGGYQIYRGKKKLRGLPATYAENAAEAQTLEVTLRDALTGLKAVLCYSVFEEYDVITRNIRYENAGAGEIALLSAQSACVDFYGKEYNLLHLRGDWARERYPEVLSVGRGIVTIDSKRGMSGHAHNPFIALTAKNADENSGEVYGFSLVYSGNFSMSAEGDSCGGTRVTAGLNPFGFDWPLAPGDVFQTPEVVMVHSGEGIGGMSRVYHRMYRERLCRGKYRDAPRPMVINNWEGTGFDFDEKKLLDIAKVGAEIGLELFVLDDGWFGARGGDTCSLGDWHVNSAKLPNGLRGVADAVNGMGMKFGLWFEPEMVSPDSLLYRAHPDWCVFAEGRKRTENRYQLVLDLSREEVCEYIIGAVSEVLRSANIEYVKWDCNRNLTETADQTQPHKYMLGLYRVLETLAERFPNVLFEGCGGGGGRFDPGMLYYMPQTWTSDNTNPIARLKIQHGTSVVYPPITMAAHIGSIDTGRDCRNAFMDVCARVAMAGNFGFEMDLTRLSAAERRQAAEIAARYKHLRQTVQFGDFYRLESPFDGGAAWEFVSADGKQAVLFTYQTQTALNGESRRVFLKGLSPSASYRCNGKVYSGAALARAGIGIALEAYEYAGEVMVFEKIESEFEKN
ncbi:MAG: alpha-galactosidase [Clostridiales bacterium]|jgi:alpha-galactosidase|nr:alpha-galactosidase [Clostridiales bacterium]